MGYITGRTNYFKERNEGKEIIWSYRLGDATDDKKKPLSQDIIIEMRGKHMKGQISNGDIIILQEKFRKGKIYTPKRVFNKTFGTEVGQK